MIAKELIDQLKDILDKYGDKEVLVNGYGILQVYYDNLDEDINIEA